VAVPGRLAQASVDSNRISAAGTPWLHRHP